LGELELVWLSWSKAGSFCHGSICQYQRPRRLLGNLSSHPLSGTGSTQQALCTPGHMFPRPGRPPGRPREPRCPAGGESSENWTLPEPSWVIQGHVNDGRLAQPRRSWWCLSTGHHHKPLYLSRHQVDTLLSRREAKDGVGDRRLAPRARRGCTPTTKGWFLNDVGRIFEQVSYNPTVEYLDAWRTRFIVYKAPDFQTFSDRCRIIRQMVKIVGTILLIFPSRPIQAQPGEWSDSRGQKGWLPGAGESTAVPWAGWDDPSERGHRPPGSGNGPFIRWPPIRTGADCPRVSRPAGRTGRTPEENRNEERQATAESVEGDA
jgi:hypothetical protein